MSNCKKFYVKWLLWKVYLHENEATLISVLIFKFPAHFSQIINQYNKIYQKFSLTVGFTVNKNQYYQLVKYKKLHILENYIKNYN